MTGEPAVEFVGVALGQAFRGASRAFETGTMTAVITSRENENAIFTRVVTGLARPESGRVLVLGQDLAGLSRDELNGLRRRVGVAYPDGGLISNLKVIENITLPLLYHSDLSAREIEETAVALLERLGYAGNIFGLPGLLPMYERRLTGLARAMAADPDVAVYDRLLDGLHEDERAFFLRTVSAFHGEKAGRTSIFLTSNPGSLAGIEGCGTVHIRKGQFE
jgi:phospholipid/cholesterol/gamma-HCH transport system ATP-binding protein